MNPASVSEHPPEEPAPAHGHDHTLIGRHLFSGVLVTLLLLGIGLIPAINHHGTGIGFALCAIVVYWIAFGVRKRRRVDEAAGEPPLVVRFWDGLYAALLTTLLVSLLFHLTPLASHGERLAFEMFHSGRGSSLDLRP